MTLFFILSKTLEALTLLSSTSLTSFTKKTSLPVLPVFQFYRLTQKNIAWLKDLKPKSLAKLCFLLLSENLPTDLSR